MNERIAQIEKFAAKEFRSNPDAADFVSSWLSCFYGSNDVAQTMMGQSLIFSDFGGNLFYRQNKAMLYPLCSHALMSYAEGFSHVSQKKEGSVGIVALMQGIEPTVHAARICGVEAVGYRERVVALTQLLSGGEQ